MDKDKLLDLYSEDFRYYSDWEDICNILGVDETKTDKVTISYNKVIVNNPTKSSPWTIIVESCWALWNMHGLAMP